MKMIDLTFTTQVLAGDHNVNFILFQTVTAIELGKKWEFNQYFFSEFIMVSKKNMSQPLTLEEFWFCFFGRF